MISIEFWEGLGVGLSASVTGTIALWIYLRQRQRRRAQTLDLASRSPTAAFAPRASAPVASTAPAGALSLPGREAPTVRPFAPPVPVEVSTAPGALTPENGGQLKISHRVIMHIARQGQLGPDEVPPRALTQAGMVELLAVNQGALTGVLRRLVAAGMLEENKEHVRGADRRLKVYRLTPAGAELHKDLRTRRPP